jgi:VIT1/CCC1 family predicted Fe2+/Mn2+ transporter
MALTAGELEILITANTSEIKKLNSELGSLDKQGQKNASTFKTLTSSFISANAIYALGAKTLQVLSQEFTKSIKVATDFNESQSKLNTTFKSVQSEANKLRDNLVKNFSLSKKAATELLGSTGDLLTGFGFTQKSALNLSNQVQKLAADLASFQNLEGGVEQASQALTKALLGETESAKTLGIVIRETDVVARLAEQGLKGLTGEALLQAKAQIRLQIAVEQSKNAIGDLERTSQSLANRQRQLGAEYENLQIAIGQKFIGATTAAVNATSDLVRGFTKLVEGSPASQIEKERDELNLLAVQLLNTSTSEKRRIQLVNEINSKYPNFLKNLDAEKTSTEEIKKALVEVNKQYKDKIIQSTLDSEKALALAGLQKTIADAERSRLKLQIKIIDSAKQYGITTDQLTGSFEDQIKKIREAAIAQNQYSGGTLAGLNATSALEKELRKQNKAQDEASAAQELYNEFIKEQEALLKALNIQVNDNTEATKENEKEKKKTVTGNEKEILNTKIDAIKTAEEEAKASAQRQIDLEREKTAQIRQLYTDLGNGIANGIQQGLSLASQASSDYFANEIEKIETEKEERLARLEERLALERELIENDGLTRAEARAEQLAQLEQDLLLEEDLKKQEKIKEQINELQKKQELDKLDKQFAKEKEKEEKKAAKKKYQLDVAAFNTKKALDLTNAGISLAQSIANSIAAAASAAASAGIAAPAVFAAVSAALSGISGAVIGAQIGIIASKQPPPPPKFARGTSFAPGGSAIVGEEGPELINLPRGSRVTPARETGGLFRQQSNTYVSVYIDGNKIPVNNILVENRERAAIATRN